MHAHKFFMHYFHAYLDLSHFTYIVLFSLKIEKRHLKVLRRIHWRNTQSLKEKLSQYPPSYNLVFDRSKINFARLQPYVYVLIHEVSKKIII